MKQLKKIISIVLSLMLIMTPMASFAHSGRTDMYGGHHDYQNASGLGSYHFHHGMGPHLHPGGVCPYDSPSPKPPSVPSPPPPTSNTYVKMPAYAITVNGTVINNTKSKYPILSYKNITYFPMTYNYASALGLITVWNQTTGFSISKNATRRPSQLIQDLTGSNSTTTKYKAVLPTFSINVNGKRISNSLEEYPLFVFRDITYFPMTWRFAVTEFGFTTSWSNTTGFSIVSQ